MLCAFYKCVDLDLRRSIYKNAFETFAKESQITATERTGEADDPARCENRSIAEIYSDLAALGNTKSYCIISMFRRLAPLPPFLSPRCALPFKFRSVVESNRCQIGSN